MDFKGCHLHKNITSKILDNNGFTQLSNYKYMICTNLYEESIAVQMFINILSGEIEFDIIDKNTRRTYAPFWNNINGENNLVAIQVINNFEKYLKELQENGILYMEDNN